jgi:hypothetical protein
MAALLFSSYPQTVRIQIAQSVVPPSAASSLNFRCSITIRAKAHPSDNADPLRNKEATSLNEKDVYTTPCAYIQNRLFPFKTLAN